MFMAAWALTAVVISAAFAVKARSQAAPAGASQVALTTAPVDDAALRAAVDSIVERTLNKPGAVGFSVAVARGDKVIISKGYGLADVELNVPADANTIFRIGSVTKQFTAAMIMRMVEQGKISLDDDLAKYVPEFPMQGHKVTIRQLLNHTSGIPSYTDLGEEWEKVRPLELTHEQMIALVKDKPFDFEPGEKWKYNNTGYYLLGMIIEKVSGQTYAECMMAGFFKPLGLKHTRYDVTAEIVKGRAQGYSVEKGVLENDAPLGMSQPFAAGSLISTAEDLIRWQMALNAGDGQVVSSDSYKQMTTPTILPSGRNTEYGFGLGIDEWEGHKRISHGGGINGFTSSLSYLPDDRLHVAVISNCEVFNPELLVRSITRAALGIPEQEVKDLTLTADEIKPILGRFVLEKINLPIEFSEQDGKVIAQAKGQRQTALLYQGNGEFRAGFDNDVKMIFDLSPDGSPAKSFTLYQGGAELKASRSQDSSPTTAPNDASP
jgi:CubicO group peptidase (beta-lactamase class C family)